MKRPQPETVRRRKRMAKNKERVQFLLPGRMLPEPPMVRPPPPATNEVKLAAIAVELNIRLRSADMPGAMQERAFRFSRALLDANNLKSKNPNPTHIVMSLKKEFDAMLGMALHRWQELWVVFNSLIWWICMFFHGQPLFSSFQDRGPTTEEATSIAQVQGIKWS